MSGDVIVTVTLNAALHVAYTADDEAAEGIIPVSRPAYRAGGRGVTVARVLRAFGHDVLAAGLAGGASGELIIQDLARSGASPGAGSGWPAPGAARGGGAGGIRVSAPPEAALRGGSGGIRVSSPPE